MRRVRHAQARERVPGAVVVVAHPRLGSDADRARVGSSPVFRSRDEL